MNRKNIYSFISVLIFCLMADATSSQEVYHFTKALVVNAPNHYGREAIYSDALAYQLYTNTLKQPVENANFGSDEKGQAMNWQPVVADSIFRLSTRRFGGGFGTTRYYYLTYNSDKEKTALLNIRGNASVFVNGVPHMGDAYNSGWLYIPVHLKAGNNEFYVRGQSIIASMTFPSKPVSLNVEDPTIPFIVLNQNAGMMQAAIVIINGSPNEIRGAQIKSTLGGNSVVTAVPAIPAMSTRKVSFQFSAESVNAVGTYKCEIALLQKGKVVDESRLDIPAVNSNNQYSVTFTSDIDGSLQYYAVTPQSGNNNQHSALFLSVHGAGVEAIGQARAYKPKDWGNLVAATNRRPRGFNWEDWGRIDALEVFNLAKLKFNPDPKQIYLTGHSMGGHGTWFLGATYPDKWAAIAACAGYPTLKGYGSADGLIPDSGASVVEQMLLRAGNQSDVIKLASNYKPLGVYIFHGDADRTVSVNYARQMRKLLADFHSDLSYYEYPGGEHWFGDQSVDWKPIFDFFKWHTLAPDSMVNNIDFITSSPGISSSFRWASIYQQIQPLEYSKIHLVRNRTSKTISGNTENIRLMKFNLKDFGSDEAISISLDNLEKIQYTTKSGDDSLFLLRTSNKWIITEKPSLFEKGPHRYGAFKDAFNHRMIFVYGTKGTREENEWSLNKARYDAETWYYRGNGAVDIISDKEFALSKYADRGVILFGNANTNAAWKQLLEDCPIRVERNMIKAGAQTWNGDDLSAYFVWPIRGSEIASVGVVSGTGLKGMKAANGNQYFAGASGFPDFMIFGLNMLDSGSKGVKMAGFFDHDWKLTSSEWVQNK